MLAYAAGIPSPVGWSQGTAEWQCPQGLVGLALFQQSFFQIWQTVDTFGLMHMFPKKRGSTWINDFQNALRHERILFRRPYDAFVQNICSEGLSNLSISPDVRFHLVPVVAAAEATAWTPTSPWNQDHGESWRMDQHEHVEKIGEMSTKMTQNPHANYADYANYANYANWLLLDISNHDDVGCVALGHGLRPLKLKKLVCRSLWHLDTLSMLA